MARHRAGRRDRLAGIASISISFAGYLIRPRLGLGALFFVIYIKPWKAAGSRAVGTRQASQQGFFR